jgi:hypothetical protein
MKSACCTTGWLIARPVSSSPARGHGQRPHQRRRVGEAPCPASCLIAATEGGRRRWPHRHRGERDGARGLSAKNNSRQAVTIGDEDADGDDDGDHQDQEGGAHGGFSCVRKTQLSGARRAMHQKSQPGAVGRGRARIRCCSMATPRWVRRIGWSAKRSRGRRPAAAAARGCARRDQVATRCTVQNKASKSRATEPPRTTTIS